MASNKFNPASMRARVFFRYGGRPFNRALGAETDRAAWRTCALIDQTIEDSERGRLTMPPDADPVAFIVSGGKVSHKPKAEPGQANPRPPTLGDVFSIYAETSTPGFKESNTLITELVHTRHFRRVIGEGFVLDSLDVASIQKYVDKRHTDNVGRETIHKELATLRVIWTWALKCRHIITSPDLEDGRPDSPQGSREAALSDLGTDH